MQPLPIGNSTMIKWNRLRDPATQHYVNSATVTAQVLDSAGAVVTGCGAIPVNYVADSDGVYVGWVPATAPLVDGDNYTVVVTAVYGGGVYTAKRYVECKAQKKGSS